MCPETLPYYTGHRHYFVYFKDERLGGVSSVSAVNTGTIYTGHPTLFHTGTTRGPLLNTECDVCALTHSHSNKLVLFILRNYSLYVSTDGP